MKHFKNFLLFAGISIVCFVAYTFFYTKCKEQGTENALNYLCLGIPTVFGFYWMFSAITEDMNKTSKH